MNFLSFFSLSLYKLSCLGKWFLNIFRKIFDLFILFSNSVITHVDFVLCIQLSLNILEEVKLEFLLIFLIYLLQIVIIYFKY